MEFLSAVYSEHSKYQDKPGKKDKATMAVLEQTKLFGYVWVS